ncbi:MAG: hypothetical protein JXM73_23415 [Anaerolineae bacterium]|nr:hypothetical protein [Anaerolineae bacterium]
MRNKAVMAPVFILTCLAWCLPGCVAAEPPRAEPSLPEAVAPITIMPVVPTPLPAIAPDEHLLDAGLRWRECRASDLDWRQGEACLGYSLSALGSGGTAGTRTEDGELLLTVNGDIYETHTRESDLLPRASLRKNGRVVRTICDGTFFHSPNISLQFIDGKAAWEFYGERVQTIIYDGQDLRSQYGLDAAYRPYELDGKLILIGKRDNTYFILYGGEQVGPPFDEITIGYCCEIVLYTPRFGEERYMFWGQREGKAYVVEITPAGQADQAGP